MNNLTQNIFRCIVEHRNASGQLLKRSSFIPNSVVQAYIGFLSVQFSFSTLTLRDITNNNISVSPTAGICRIDATINIDSHGIVVGSGTNAVTINDYKLQSQISQGTSAGLLQYSGMEFPSLYSVDSSKAFTSFRRLFTNLSGSSITINELGVYIRSYQNNIFCVERTLYNAILADEEALSVTYVLKKEIL